MHSQWLFNQWNLKSQDISAISTGWPKLAKLHNPGRRDQTSAGISVPTDNILRIK